jgi:GxxExxY protein
MNADSQKRDPETYAIIGAAMEVHRELGYGFLEAVYQDALAVELNSRGVPFEREKLLRVFYKGGTLPCTYKADFVCFGNVLVECKALTEVGGAEEAQVLNYIRITQLPRAVLLNFGTRMLGYKRLVFSPEKICVNLCKSADKISL